MITPAHKVDALWFEPGTAADAAAAINAARAPVKWVSPSQVREHWREAQRLGRLPPFERPAAGFGPGPISIIRRFLEVKAEKAA